MDPQQTSDGEPYGPWRYQEIVHECYILSKYIHTPYIDLLNISPLERKYLLKFLNDDFEEEKQAMEQVKLERDSKKQ